MNKLFCLTVTFLLLVFSMNASVEEKSNDIRQQGEELTRVRKDGKEFHIRADGSRPYTQTYDNVGEFSEGLAWVRDKGKEFHIRPDGSRAYTQKFNHVQIKFSEGLAWVKIDGRGFHIRPDGSRAYRSMYEAVGPFSEGLAWVKTARQMFHIRPDSTRAYQETYNRVGGFSEGFAWVRKGREWFHIRPDGTRAYKETYNRVGWFRDGIARVKKDEQWFHIRPDGSKLYEEKYDNVGWFRDGIARVKKGEKEFYIRNDGSRIDQQIDDNTDFIKLEDSLKGTLPKLTLTVPEEDIDGKPLDITLESEFSGVAEFPFAGGGTYKIQYTFLNQHAVEGNKHIYAVASYTTGGSGHYYYLTAIDKTTRKSVSEVYLGDRVKVESVSYKTDPSDTISDPSDIISVRYKDRKTTTAMAAPPDKLIQMDFKMHQYLLMYVN